MALPHTPLHGLPPLSPAEASKKILQYLAACSGHAGAVDVVKDRLLESTPVLEVSAIGLCGWLVLGTSAAEVILRT